MTRKKNDENSFVFYRSFYDVVHMIPDEAMRSKAYEAICEYAFYGVEPDESADILVRMVFTQAKPQLDANAQRRENSRSKAKKQDLHEMRSNTAESYPMTEQIPDRTELETVEMKTDIENATIVNQSGTEAVPDVYQVCTDSVPNVNENANVNVNVNVNENETVTENAKQTAQKSTRFTPPTHAQVTEYINENDLHVDAGRFMDYYIANGWKVGKNAMKSWKAALRNWARHEDSYTCKPHNSKGGNSYGAITPQFGICL